MCETLTIVVVIYDYQAWYAHITWWHHQIETFSALLFLCAVNSPRSFDIFFDLGLNKRWSKQSWGWWFETPTRSLWRHWNDILLQSVTRPVIFHLAYTWLPFLWHLLLGYQLNSIIWYFEYRVGIMFWHHSKQRKPQHSTPQILLSKS